jgi:hypothetical protein
MTISFSYNDVLEHIDLNNIVLGLKNSGVVSDPDSTSLSVGEKDTPDMGIKVEPGNCTIDGVAYSEDASINLTIAAADVTNARKDIVIYYGTAGNPVVITGTPAAIPVPPDISANSVLLALVDVSANATQIDSGDVTDKRVFVTTSAVPSGTIVLWHGLLVNIPVGWVLCDGTNSTPDLREKFVRGAANLVDPGGTGGLDTHTHTTATDGDHVHNYTGGGAHIHDTDQSVSYQIVQSGSGANVSNVDHVHDVLSTGSDHSHNVEDTGSDHSHNVNAGSTLPSYYSIAYIMKT